MSQYNKFRYLSQPQKLPIKAHAWVRGLNFCLIQYIYIHPLSMCAGKAFAQTCLSLCCLVIQELWESHGLPRTTKLWTLSQAVYCWATNDETAWLWTGVLHLRLVSLPAMSDRAQTRTSEPQAEHSSTVKPVLSGHSKEDQRLVFKTDYRLMQVKSIAECSMSAFCNTFDLH